MISVSRRNRRTAISLLAVAAALVFAAGGRADTGSPMHYNVALGDSLAASYQPNGDDRHGYVEQLYTVLKVNDPKLGLVKLGCGGESTVTMRFGSQDPTVVLSCAGSRGYKDLYPKETQLAEAVAFLQAHKGKVGLVTIDIGANLVICAAILAALRAAAGPGVPVVGMSYYDVFAPLCASDASLLFVCSRVDAFNAILVDTYRAAQAPVADVAGAFENDDVTHAAAHVCDWTWFCTLEDIHTNTAGYAVIAQAFSGLLEPSGAW